MFKLYDCVMFLYKAKVKIIMCNFVHQYRFFGKQVVKAAVENGCHHLDVSGEPEVIRFHELHS